MRKIGWVALALGLASTTAQADVSEIYGKWVPADDQCRYGDYVSSALFTIMPGKIQYFENTCDMVGTPQPVGMAFSVTVSCEAVEGDNTVVTTTYEKADGGLIVRASDGYTYVAKSCP